MKPLLLTLFAFALIIPATSRGVTLSSAEILVDTENEFSGIFSLLVGHVDPVTGMETPTVFITLNGQIPGSAFSAVAGYNGAFVRLNGTELQAAGLEVSFEGRWYDEMRHAMLDQTLVEYEYHLTGIYRFGGLNEGWDLDDAAPETDYYWGYWDGTFAIKRLREPDGVADQGMGIILFGFALGLLGGARRVVSPKRGSRRRPGR
jgi:hypothetical protein